MAEYVMFAAVLLVVLASPAAVLLISTLTFQSPQAQVAVSAPAVLITDAQIRRAAQQVAKMAIASGHSAARAERIRVNYLGQFGLSA